MRKKRPGGRPDGRPSLAGDAPVDAAILDVNLEGSTSYLIADRLAEISVPFLFLTGYDDWVLPKPYREAPRLAKPFQLRSVLSRVEQLLGSGGDPWSGRLKLGSA